MKKILYLLILLEIGCSSATKQENLCERTCMNEGSKLVRVEPNYCVCSSDLKKTENIKLLELKKIQDEN